MYVGIVRCADGRTIVSTSALMKGQRDSNSFRGFIVNLIVTDKVVANTLKEISVVRGTPRNESEEACRFAKGKVMCGIYLNSLSLSLSLFPTRSCYIASHNSHDICFIRRFAYTFSTWTYKIEIIFFNEILITTHPTTSQLLVQSPSATYETLP